MEEQLKGELARIMQQTQGLMVQRDSLINQTQQITSELVKLQGEERLIQKLLQQLNNLAEAEEAESEEE